MKKVLLVSLLTSTIMHVSGVQARGEIQLEGSDDQAPIVFTVPAGQLTYEFKSSLLGSAFMTIANGTLGVNVTLTSDDPALVAKALVLLENIEKYIDDEDRIIRSAGNKVVVITIGTRSQATLVQKNELAKNLFDMLKPVAQTLEVYASQSVKMN